MQVQSTVITELWKTALPKAKDFWLKVQHRLPRNIFNFIVRYMNNSHACFSNLARGGINVSASCTFCREVQTTKHIVAGCASCLNRYTWRHNSVLLSLPIFLQPIVKKLYCDIPSFLSPVIETGTAARPDLLVVDRMNNLFIFEPTVGHESNTVANATRKAKKYEHFLNDSDLKLLHRKICFLNLVITAIGIYSKHSEEFFKMFTDLNIDNNAAT